MGANDPWVNYPFRWAVTVNVIRQSHSSHLTPTPYAYDGLDVHVGDWIADITAGISVKVIGFLSQGYQNVVLICEDVDRFNTFTDVTATGLGIFNPGNGVVFSLNDEGLPVLGPMSAVATMLRSNPAWQQDQISRFQYRNYTKTFYPVLQPGANLLEGDPISLGTDALYHKTMANSAACAAIIGHVTSVGAPGPDWFTYRPLGKVCTNLNPPLPGLPGELIYWTATGMSNVVSANWAVPQYIRVDATTGVEIGRGIDVSGGFGRSTRSLVGNAATIANSVQTLQTGDLVVMTNDGPPATETDYIVTKTGVLRPIGANTAAEPVGGFFTVVVAPSVPLIPVTVMGIPLMAIQAGTLAVGQQITDISLTIQQPFGATVIASIGTDQDKDTILSRAMIDLTYNGSYDYQPDGVTAVLVATPVYVFLNFMGTTAGHAVIVVTYI